MFTTAGLGHYGVHEGVLCTQPSSVQSIKYNGAE